MTTRLILIRHGASHHKDAGIAGGPQGCRGLNDTGRRQAEALAQRLARELEDRPAAIYASVIPRAIETAEIVAAALGDLAVVQDCGLCTWHIPAEADGRLWTDYGQENRLAGGGVFRPFQRGNETWGEMAIRAGRSLEEIASRHAGNTVLAVTHKEPIVCSFIAFGGLPLAPGFEMNVANTSITEWSMDGDPDAWPRPQWTLERFNDCAHWPSGAL